MYGYGKKAKPPKKKGLPKAVKKVMKKRGSAKKK